jgi:hypothetical protein
VYKCVWMMMVIHLFVVAGGPSIPIALSGQEGDRGGGPCPLKGLIPIFTSLEPV